ncbi:MAG: hypothetical protein QOD32_991 [Pyrinomonadaceae bacterium]|jgi:esterase/lipase superfamily enzyme|nr:hypothetical protein [Pyrinomonadaceae bacterium]
MSKLLLTFWLAVSAALTTAAPPLHVTPAPQRAASPVVWVQTYDREGRPAAAASGFFVQPDVVLTRLNLIASADTARAFAPGDRRGFKVLGVVGVDRELGLVLLKLEGARGVPPTLDDGEWLKKGGDVEALGSNANLQETRSPARVSSVNLPRYEITGAIPAASYGGPVLTRDGKAVGVVLGNTATRGTLLAASVERVPSLVARMTPLKTLSELRERADSASAPRDTSADDPPIIIQSDPPADTTPGRAPASSSQQQQQPPPVVVRQSQPAPPLEARRAPPRTASTRFPGEPETPVQSAPPPPLAGATPDIRDKTVGKATGAETKPEPYTIVPIFYGTDRARTGATEPRDFYGAGRGKLELGMCEVSIPSEHVPGQLESPSIWRLEFKEDPKLHVVLLSVKPLDAGEFHSQFQTRLGAAASRDVFVFVHGYNVKFVDAARRTAQLAYDLNFPGVPVLYSWPSQGSLSGYTTDENEVVWTEPHLKQFLTDLAAQGASGARIHLVAHSMGNRALTNVLRSLAAERATPLFSEVILTAPDVDAEVFGRDLAPAIQKIARRVTLYASSSDTALLASKKIHGYPRAGDSLPEIIVVPGMDSIDASGIDTDMLGHSYFAQMKVVMDDMKLLLIASKLPGERSLLEQIRGASRYWRLPGVIVTRNGGTLTPGARLLSVRNGLLLAVLLVACAVAVWLILRARRRVAN